MTTESATFVPEYYPLDVRTLSKGDIISAAECERLTGGKRSQPNYPLMLLGLRDAIARELKKIGVVYTLRISHGEILVCTDAEAARYNRRIVKLSVRRVRRSHIRNLHVDTSKLTDEQRKSHERSIIHSGILLAASRSSRKKLGPPASPERKTPVIKVERIGEERNG